MRVDGATALVRSEASAPLQVVAPRRRGPSACAFLVSHGGGLVAGDEVEVELEVGPDAAAHVATQAETKVYRAHAGRGCRQDLAASVARGGVLAWLPEPVSPFAEARYAQRQRFELARGASLVALDAVVAGRAARGERWAFDRHHSATEVSVDGRLLVADALLLEPRPGGELAARLGRFEALATALAVGPAFAAGAAALRDRLAAGPVEAGAGLLAAASPLADGLLLRCAAESAEALAAFLRGALAFVAGPLQADPFAHHW